MATQISNTLVGNMALKHLGATKPISDIDTDASTEAAQCRFWLPICVEELLRDFAHPFATTIQALQLVAEDPNDEWGFSYRYPNDCMMVKRILSGVRNDSRQSLKPYKIIYDSQGKLILTDREDAQCEYTILQEILPVWPRDLIIALSFLMASYMAPSIVKSGDSAKLGELAAEQYEAKRLKAEANALKESQEDEPPESEFIRGRD